jgi:tetratricopeptide (TPR) repeat protein
MIRKIAFIAFLIITSCSQSVEKKKESYIQKISSKIAKSPKNIDLLNIRSDYNRSKGNLKLALFDLKEIVKIDSLNAINHYNIAQVYFDLLKAESQNPNFPSLVKFHLQKSISIDNNFKESHSLMGELLLSYNRFEEAVDLFNESLKIEYNQERVHMLLGYAFKQLNKTNEAINCFGNALNINPDFFEAHVQLGHAFHSLGDTIALSYYNNALILDPKNIQVLYNKALFFQSILNWNDALETYAELHKISPFHSNGHYNLGFINMELGKYDIATNNFSDAIYSNSEFFEAYYSRGFCFENLGNINQAVSDYTRAIAINPKYNYAIDALEKITKR